MLATRGRTTTNGATGAVIRGTPFHERTNALNETQLWSHWSGHLAATRYQMSDKMEYFAVRNAAGLFDSSPLFKYRITGADTETFLAGVLARDIRACGPGHAQYTCWLDDRGFVIEDGVILRTGRDEFLLTCAEPNFAYFEDRIDRHDVSDRGGQPRHRDARPPGPAQPRPAQAPRPPDGAHPVLRGREGRDRWRRRDGQPDRLQRRPRLRGLGRDVRRDPRLGHAVGVDGRPRRAAVRARRAVHAAHRGGPAAARRRLRLEPVRVERLAPVDPDRARLGLDVQGPQGGRPGLHRAQGPRAGDRRQDVALARCPG